MQRNRKIDRDYERRVRYQLLGEMALAGICLGLTTGYVLHTLFGMAH